MTALEVRTLRDAARPTAIIADRRLYLTADRATVVEEGDLRAAFLLAGQGSEIPAVEVERLGLTVDGDARVVRRDGGARTAETEHDTRADDKARSAAPNKARWKGEDK